MVDLNKFFSMGEGRKVKKLGDAVQLVNTWEPEFEELTDSDLAGKTAEFRRRLADGEKLDDLLPEAFAAVREAARRSKIGRAHV